MVIYIKETDSLIDMDNVYGLVFEGKLSPNKFVDVMDVSTGQVLGSGKLRSFMYEK